MPFAVGNNPFAAGVGDFNNDAKPDFVTANNGNNNATVRLNTTIPANDNFADAITLVGAEGVVTGTNLGATRELNEPPTHAGNAGGASVWYRWQPPTNGSYTFTTYGSGFDTLLVAYTGSFGSLLDVAHSDDDTATFCQPSSSRMTIANANTATTYFIVVDGKNAQTGPIRLRWGRSASIGGEMHGGPSDPIELSGDTCRRVAVSPHTSSRMFLQAAATK